SITEVAKQYVHGSDIKEGMLNRVESTIRCYDPCLSCSTHAIGRMPLQLELYDHQGQLIREHFEN
ncbi:MAG: Ni/Fe hydrogenase subunit alpha, partial [Flavisolibacter sp.]